MTRLALVLALLLGFTNAAEAHLLPKQNATMNIVENSAFFVVSVPASALTGVDDDASGSLSLAEVQAHDSDIQQQFVMRFQVSAKGAVGVPVMTWVLPPQTDGSPTDSDYVVLMHRVDFSATPDTPRLETDLFGSRAGEGQMTVTATRGKTSEIAILQAGGGAHTFFRGRIAIFTDFIRIGVAHVLTGADHLLFLLTIIIAASGWRYWLAVTTSFTIGHSVTLALSALGILRIPAQIVEPGIAASIVLMAWLNLRRGARSGSVGWSRPAVVLACGLLHGFGFASAVGAIPVDASSRLATLAGFNLGIEIGQFIFLGGILLLASMLTHIGRKQVSVAIPRLASAAAVVIGTVLLIERLAPIR